VCLVLIQLPVQAFVHLVQLVPILAILLQQHVRIVLLANIRVQVRLDVRIVLLVKSFFQLPTNVPIVPQVNMRHKVLQHVLYAALEATRTQLD
jgi:hypothetical protein